MNPPCELRTNETVMIYTNSPTQRTLVIEPKRPLMAKIHEICWDGRKHARYVAFVRCTLVNTGDSVLVGVEQLMCCDANFEPKYKFLTCLFCSAVVKETSIKKTAMLGGQPYCPHCFAHNPFTDE